MTPLVVTIAVSFGSSTVFTLPPPDWSLRWYQRLANTRGLLPALVVSLQVAAISTAIAMVLGTLCAIALVRGRFPGREAIATFLVSPLMLPGLVIGIAMLQGFKALGPARRLCEPAGGARRDHPALRRAHRAWARSRCSTSR